MATHSAKIMQVIKTVDTCACDTSTNCKKTITRFWSMSGELLATDEHIFDDTAKCVSSKN